MGLFDWFSSRTTGCPIDDATRSWVDQRWAWLEAEFGVERLRGARVIRPQPKYFPDPYFGTELDARRIFDRLCGYLDLDPARMDLMFYDDQSPLAGQPGMDGPWNGTAGLYTQDGDRFQIWIEFENLDDPLSLVATMAHELGHVHLLGHGRVSAEADDHEPLTDLLTIFFGLGIITANSVVREQTWQDGMYSGWKVGRRGYLTMQACGYALARFARARGEDGSLWITELRPDVQKAFKQSMAYLSREDEQADTRADDEAGSSESNARVVDRD